jgi:predicted ATP-dependent protease
LAEAEKLGLKKILVPFANLKSANLSSKKIEIIGVKRLKKLFDFYLKIIQSDTKSYLKLLN